MGCGTIRIYEEDTIGTYNAIYVNTKLSTICTYHLERGGPRAGVISIKKSTVRFARHIDSKKCFINNNFIIVITKLRV